MQDLVTQALTQCNHLKVIDSIENKDIEPLINILTQMGILLSEQNNIAILNDYDYKKNLSTVDSCINHFINKFSDFFDYPSNIYNNNHKKIAVKRIGVDDIDNMFGWYKLQKSSRGSFYKWSGSEYLASFKINSAENDIIVMQINHVDTKNEEALLKSSTIKVNYCAVKTRYFKINDQSFLSFTAPLSKSKHLIVDLCDIPGFIPLKANIGTDTRRLSVSLHNIFIINKKL